MTDMKIWVMALNNKSNSTMKTYVNNKNGFDMENDTEFIGDKMSLLHISIEDLPGCKSIIKRDKSEDKRYDKVALTNKLIFPLKASPPIIKVDDTFTEKQHFLLTKGWPLHSFDKPVEILSQIWLSGIAFDEDLPIWCKNRGFTHIVNAAGESGRSSFYKTHPNDHNIKYLELNMEDVPHYELGPHLSDIYAFLYYAYECKGKILIHCMWGQSRSVSCLIYFVMMYWGIKYDATLGLIKKVRPSASPNYGFELQLRMIDVARQSIPHKKKVPDQPSSGQIYVANTVLPEEPLKVKLNGNHEVKNGTTGTR